ncbi:MAG: hypothetical protein Q7R41_02905, partial [Phycisphaerales bacterium]|nr:hypothetical protein [Phycisphaerales bacterium]
MDGAKYSGRAGVMDMFRQVTVEAIGMIGKRTVWWGAAACVAVVASAAAQAPNPGIRKPPLPVNRPRPTPQAEPQAEEVQTRSAPQPQPDQARLGQPQKPQPPPPDRVSELLKRVDPAILARLAGADVTVEIIGDQVILHGPEEVVKTLELLIRGLDAEFQIKRKVVEIVQVSERDANEIAKSVESALRDALKKPNQLPEEQLKLTALSSNILLVSALPEEIDLVLETIKQLDLIPDPLGKIELMRFQVKYRKASDVS